MIGTPFHKVKVIFDKNMETFSIAAEIPCILVLLYSAYRIVADGSYSSESLAMTILSFLLLLAGWLFLALLGFAVYSVAIMIVLSVLSLIAELGNIFYEFGKRLLTIGEEEHSFETKKRYSNNNSGWNKNTWTERRENFQRMYREANEAYSQEKTKKENEEREANRKRETRLSKAEEIRNAKALFGLNNDFTIQELKEARNRLMRKYHPDNQGGSSSIARKINAYYELLIPYAKET